MLSFNCGHPKSKANSYIRQEVYKACRTCRRLGMRKYRKENLEKSRASARKSSRLWRLRNLDKCKVRRHRYKARKLGAKGAYTHAEWVQLKSDCNNCCVKCERTEAQLKQLGLLLVPDHIRALSKGGSNFISNIQPLCHGRGGCNNSKAAKYENFKRKVLTQWIRRNT